MSYRLLVLPERAMETVMSNLVRRIATLEKRLKWPGATRFAENLVETTYGASVWTEVVSVSLDRGRWMIYGAATLQSPTFGSLQEIRIPNSSSVPSGSTTAFGGFGPGSITLSVIGVLTLTERSEATVESRSSVASGSTTSAFIIAVPI